MSQMTLCAYSPPIAGKISQLHCTFYLTPCHNSNVHATRDEEGLLVHSADDSGAIFHYLHRLYHKVVAGRRHGIKVFQKFSTLGRASRIAGRQTEYQGTFKGHCAQLQFSCPSSSGFVVRLGVCFLRHSLL